MEIWDVGTKISGEILEVKRGKERDRSSLSGQF